ncbi:hypothetical protein SNE40_004309 [Patella caerulea]|uniref:Uncharacterized protein n=1 Tax=Patella caerulea TaxID=87958 RepID=A0AAN8KBG6_PATCE
MYKSEFGLENYLTALPFELRLNLCKFIYVNLDVVVIDYPLNVVDSIALIDQKEFDLCNKEEQGDEFHYIFNCTFFNYERQKFLPADICKIKNTMSFSELMNSKDKFVLIG